MNKSELIEALAPRLGSRAQAAAAVEALVDVVLREVATGGSVGISGFGTFEKVERAPRTGRNPRTGDPVPIAQTRMPRFRPGSYFKDVVADPSALPAQGLAGARVGSDGGAERTGAPSSVRRTTGNQTGAGGSTGAPSTARTPTSGGPRGATDGAPESVRRTEATPRPAAQGKSPGPGVPPAGRLMSGGEDITLGMISAKKAQLARVKDDQVAAGTKKSAANRDAAKKGKDAKKGKKKHKGKKGGKKGGKSAGTSGGQA